VVVSYAVYPSAICNIALLALNGKLFELKLSQEREEIIERQILSRFPGAEADEVKFKKVRILLERYFTGDRVDFDVEITLPFSSDFTKKVLFETKKIPYGETRTYGWLAKILGCKNGARAVGQALKKNPIPIIIPCHRIIEKNGKIGGFSAGTHIKRRLLEIEGVNLMR